MVVAVFFLGGSRVFGWFGVWLFVWLFVSWLGWIWSFGGRFELPKAMVFMDTASKLQLFVGTSSEPVFWLWIGLVWIGLDWFGLLGFVWIGLGLDLSPWPFRGKIGTRSPLVGGLGWFGFGFEPAAL